MRCANALSPESKLVMHPSELLRCRATASAVRAEERRTRITSSSVSSPALDAAVSARADCCLGRVFRARNVVPRGGLGHRIRRRLSLLFPGPLALNASRGSAASAKTRTGSQARAKGSRRQPQRRRRVTTDNHGRRGRASPRGGASSGDRQTHDHRLQWRLATRTSAARLI